jgi:hypothetical protein
MFQIIKIRYFFRYLKRARKQQKTSKKDFLERKCGMIEVLKLEK